MSKSISGAFTKEKSDELYTPKILVECLKPFFDTWLAAQVKKEENIVIWLPFDKFKSEFNFFFGENYKCEVICTHINNDQDFFKLVKFMNYDIAISNPPFSKKLKVYQELDKRKNPWVMLGNLMQINYMEIGNYFYEESGLQMIIPDKRVSFNGNPSSFCSGYFCKAFLKDRDLEFVHLEHCNSGKNFIPSRMYEDM